MQILSSFTNNGLTTVQTARLNEETGNLVLAESSGDNRQEFTVEAAGAYELMLYLKSVFEGCHD
jgi:hypothetical protein